MPILENDTDGCAIVANATNPADLTPAESPATNPPPQNGPVLPPWQTPSEVVAWLQECHDRAIEWAELAFLHGCANQAAIEPTDPPEWGTDWRARATALLIEARAARALAEALWCTALAVRLSALQGPEGIEGAEVGRGLVDRGLAAGAARVAAVRASLAGEAPVPGGSVVAAWDGAADAWGTYAYAAGIRAEVGAGGAL